MKNKINAFLIIFLLVLSVFPNFTEAQSCQRGVNTDNCDKLIEKLKILKELINKETDLRGEPLKLITERVNSYVSAIPESAVSSRSDSISFKDSQEKEEYSVKLVESFAEIISSIRRNNLEDETGFKSELKGLLDGTELEKELKGLKEKTKKELEIDDLFPMVAEPLTKPITKKDIDEINKFLKNEYVGDSEKKEIAERIIENLKANRKEIAELEKKLLEEPLTPEGEEMTEEEKRLKNLLKEQFFIGKYLTELEEEEKQSEIKELLSLSPENEKYLDELKEGFKSFLQRKNLINSLENKPELLFPDNSLGNYVEDYISLFSEQDLILFDKMFDFELEKRVKIRKLITANIDYVYKPFIDFFGGDYIDMIEIENKPLLRVFDFEGHGWSALLDQVALNEETDQFKKSLFDMTLTEDEIKGKSDEEILKTYMKKFNEEQFERGKERTQGRLKTPAVFVYGDNIGGAGDTNAYMFEENKDIGYTYFRPYSIGILPPDTFSSLIKINKLGEDDMFGTDGLREVDQKISGEEQIKQIESLDFIGADFEQTKKNIEDGAIDGYEWTAKIEGDKIKFKKQSNTLGSLELKDDVVLVTSKSWKRYLIKREVAENVFKDSKEAKAIPIDDVDPFEVKEIEPFIGFDLNYKPQVLTFDSEFMKKTIGKRNIKVLAGRINRLNEILKETKLEEKQDRINIIIGRILVLAKEIQEYNSGSELFETLEKEQFADIFKQNFKEISKDNKIKIFTEIERLDKENKLKIDKEIIKKFLEIQTLDELLKELGDLEIC